MEKADGKFVRCSKIEKIAQILTVAEKPVLQTRILVKCSLSTKMTRQYLRQLLDSRLLECYPTENMKGLTGYKSKKRMIYQTSQKGKEFLRLYNELAALMQPEEGKNPHIDIKAKA